MVTLNTEQLESTAFILKTIAHPMRLRVVCLLGSCEHLTVSQICERVNCEQSLVSHHLNIMKLKGVLKSERRGKNIFYSLAMPQVLGIVDCVNGDCASPDNDC